MTIKGIKHKRRHTPSRGEAGQETATEAAELSEGCLAPNKGEPQ